MTPPPGELDALIRAARDVPGPPPGVAARLIERLDAAGAAGAVASGVAISKLALLLGSGALLLTGAIAGGGAVWALHDLRPAPAPIQLVVASHPRQPAERAQPEPTLEPEPKPLPQAALPAPRPPPVAVRSEPTAQSTLEEERKLLEGARAAAVAGKWSVALESVAAHAARFPDGALAEEREAIAIQAHGATDPAAAASRAAAFRRRWPSSIFEPVIERIAPRDGSSGSPQ